MPRCPECGKEIKLMVGLVEQNIAPFVCFTMALVLPAGLGFIGWVAVFREGLGNYQFHSLSRTLESLSLIGFQLAFFTLIIPLLIRRKFLRMQLRNQWICAALAEALTLPTRAASPTRCNPPAWWCRGRQARPLIFHPVWLRLPIIFCCAWRAAKDGHTAPRGLHGGWHGFAGD